MPMRWDEKARTTLLLKLVEQNPSIFSKYSAESLAASWPGSEKPTVRAIVEQVRAIKKQVAAGNFTSPASAPRPRSRYSAPSTSGSTPATPSRGPRTIPTTTTTPSKRPAARATGSPPKKRKTPQLRPAPTTDDDAEDGPDLSSSQPEDSDNASVTDTDAITTPTTRRPPRPARAAATRSRAKSCTATDSDPDENSDSDGEYSVQKEKQSCRASFQERIALRKALRAAAAAADMNAHADESEGDREPGLGDEERDSELESRVTVGSFHDAAEWM